LIIFDKARRTKFLERIGPIFGPIYLISCIVRVLKEGYNDWLYFFLFLSIAWFISAILILRKNEIETVDSKIGLENIALVTFKSNWSGQTVVAKIKTRQNYNRRILLSPANLQYKNFRDKLNKLNIETIEK